jgi:hypothetical protein
MHIQRLTQIKDFGVSSMGLQRERDFMRAEQLSSKHGYLHDTLFPLNFWRTKETRH